MDTLPPCPACGSELTYEDPPLYVCPECGNEWTADAGGGTEALVHRDVNGNVLQDGDAVTVIKDLRIKGGSQVVKAGTKVRNIRLVDEDHNIDCRIEGLGEMKLKSEFVRKA